MIDPVVILTWTGVGLWALYVVTQVLIGVLLWKEAE